HEPRPRVGDRAVAIVGIGARQALLQLTILAGASARDHRADIVVAERLPRLEALALQPTPQADRQVALARREALLRRAQRRVAGAQVTRAGRAVALARREARLRRAQRRVTGAQVTRAGRQTPVAPSEIGRTVLQHPTAEGSGDVRRVPVYHLLDRRLVPHAGTHPTLGDRHRFQRPP